MTTETWKDIAGFEGYYQVSDQGRVRSLDRTIPHKRFGTVNRKGRIIAPGSNPAGYVIYGLKREGKTKGRTAHTLVLEAFVGPRPEGKEACHNDGDRKNNRLENLRWDTNSENKMDIQRHGRNHNLNKTECPRGHSLSGANLKLGVTAKGTTSRSCVSCGRGRAIVSYDRSLMPWRDQICDMYYDRVDTGETLTREEIRRRLAETGKVLPQKTE